MSRIVALPTMPACAVESDSVTLPMATVMTDGLGIYA